jgi:hypothetical protein
MEMVLVVGEDKFGKPATVEVAERYKKDHGYQDGVRAVADPVWQKISQAVNHGFGEIGLPYIIVLDAKMKLLAKQAATNQAADLIVEATGGEPIPATCDGMCGGMALAGCYCDQECIGFGDCCPDACDLCGSCP